ncbi:MAG: single-stranded-DNA-specific exonuclease RecJ [Desulfobacterales bacterium]
MKTEWKILEPDRKAVKKVSRILNCTEVTAAVLVNRNIVSAADIRSFADFSLTGIRAPFAIRDMDTAVSRIASAISDQEKILIFGDYDADGVTATAVLLEFLQYAGADVSYYIPHRTKEGYDIQTDHIFGYALPAQTDLIITVDCGSSRHEAVQAARSSGIDVIITDHHTIDSIPPAVAVVNPKRADCAAGFGHLAGVGVVFALLICLRKHLREKGFWKKRKEPNLKIFCDLVALGTIADMVPLLEENRILSKAGLEMIRAGLRPGIRALAKVSGINESCADADDIAFRLAPRVNAAGRLNHAGMAVELLTTRNPRRAQELAQALDQLNRQRQDTEKHMTGHILKHLKSCPEKLEKSALVLSDSRWHEGVLGIVAAKLVNRFFRPVLLISAKNGMGKGSGRSIPGINLYEGLLQCAGHLEKFGGHPMAAGFQIREDRIIRFQEDFDAAIRNMGQAGKLSRQITIDCELPFEKISERLVDELESLQPFGEGNPEPLFLAADVQVSSSRIIAGCHRRMVLHQSPEPNAPRMQAMCFHTDPGQQADRFARIAYRLRWNRWNGKKTVQIIVEENEHFSCNSLALSI